jgi:hypothetical protein
MSAIKKKLENHYLFGCIKHNESYMLYLMPIAYWILNYKKYNPSYDPKEWEFVFRGDVLNVNDSSIKDFMRAIDVDKIEPVELQSVHESIPRPLPNFYFFIDFDSKLYVNSFNDIEVEQYLPEHGWTGIFDNSLNYLPKRLRSFFE